MKCKKCIMNPAVINGLCHGCSAIGQKPSIYFPLRQVYSLLIKATIVGEVFEFMGDWYRHDSNHLLQLV